MQHLSRLARRTAHLLILEAFALAILVFPLQVDNPLRRALRDALMTPGVQEGLASAGHDPSTFWAYDIEALINTGFSPLIIKEVTAKGAILFALIAWALSQLLRFAPTDPVGRRRLLWILVTVAALTACLLFGTIDPQGGRRMVWLQTSTFFTALAGLAFLMLLGELVRTRRAAERWIAALFVFTAPIAVIALLQHLGQTLLPEDRVTFLGIIPLPPRDHEFDRMRIGSLIGHNVGAALLLVPALCLTPAVWRRTRRTWVRAGLVVYALLAAWVIVRSQSRSVILALGLGVALWLVVSWALLPRSNRQPISPHVRRWLMIAAVLFLATQVVDNPLRGSQGLGRRLTRLVNSEELMTDTRMRVLVCSLPAIGERPLLGWGIGSFSWVYPEFQGRHFSDPANWDTRLTLTTKLTQRAHNDWLQLAMEMGAVGIVVVVWGLLLCWGRGWRFRRGGCPPASRALLSGILCAGVVFALQAAFDFPMHVMPTAMTALLLAALAGNAPEFLGRSAQTTQWIPVRGGLARSLRWGAVALLVAWCLWPPRWWFGPSASLNPSHMAPGLTAVLRPLASELMADARHIRAQAMMDLYYRSEELRGTREGFALMHDAQARLREALLIEPSNGVIRSRLAEVLTYLGGERSANRTAALETFRESLPEVRNYSVFYYIGECHHSLSLDLGAEASLAQAEGDEERSEELRQLQEYHWDQALIAYRRALAFNPADGYSADTLARMLMQMGESTAAAQVLRVMRRWEPTWYDERWVGHAIEDINLGRYERALQTLGVLSLVEPENPHRLAQAATCFLRLRDVEHAERVIEEIHRRFPDERALDHLDAELLVVRGDLEDAARRAREVYEETGLFQMLCLEHLALRSLGRMAEAHAVYQEIQATLVEQGRDPAIAADVLGNLAWDVFNDHETAERFYRSIVQDPPGPATLILHRLAVCAADRGERETAMMYLSMMREREIRYAPSAELWQSLIEEEL
ncbi:O-antigen ligase family protein [Candidatus Sumerlaeota bacterium]|nr:O-antigen ligase family protein [Candidatus Sumerlaeota bacterium]